MKRKKMNYKKSRADFSRKSRIHPKNEKPAAYAMRGGVRL